MKTLLLLLFFISNLCAQNVVSLSIGNKWYYEYRSYSNSSNGSNSAKYFLEKEVVGDTLFDEVSYKKIRVLKIEDRASTFIRNEYWYSDSVEFRQRGIPELVNIHRLFNQTLNDDFIGVDGFVGSEASSVLGVNTVVQKFQYNESGMANFTTEVRTAQGIGIIDISERGEVETGNSTWQFWITLQRAWIDGKGLRNTALTITKEGDIATINNFTLLQNYPNPFNPSTTISYTIPTNTKNGTVNVKLTVYDVLGREVVTLVNKEQNAGSYKVIFDASKLNSGVYFYQLQSGNFTKSKKMILLK